MRAFRELFYDLKEMGINFAVVMSGCAVSLFLLILLYYTIGTSERLNITALPLIQLLIPASGGYGAVILMQGILDTDGGEIYFTYPHPYIYWGVLRQLRFLIFFSIIVFLFTLPMSYFMCIEIQNLPIMILPQSVAVMAVSFLGIAISRKVSIGLIFLLAFVGIQITLGQEYEAFNLIFVPFGSSLESADYGKIIINSIAIGILGFGVGQTFIKPRM